MDYFPLGVDPGHLNNITLFEPERFGYDFYPDTMLICHSNPLWNLNGNQDRCFWINDGLRKEETANSCTAGSSRRAFVPTR